MSSSFRFDDPEAFTAGTVGEPGARTFFLQVVEAGQVVSLKCEKQQVAALAEYLAELLADLPPVSHEVAGIPPALVEPVLAEWVAGSMGVAWDEDDERFVIVIDEPPHPRAGRGLRAPRHRARGPGTAALPPVRPPGGPRRARLPP